MTPEQWVNHLWNIARHREGPTDDEIVEVIRQAIAKEREACAKVAEGVELQPEGTHIAQLIRARKN